MGLTLLLIDQDEAYAEWLRKETASLNWTIAQAISGTEALEALRVLQPDCIVLDLAVPDVPGLVFLNMLVARKDCSRLTPLIVCSAQQERVDVVLSLKLGADDFVKKPVDLEDLKARIERLVRRKPPLPEETVDLPSIITVGGLVVDTKKVEVTFRERPVHLTPSGFRLLVILARSVGVVRSAADLHYELRGVPMADIDDEHVVHVHLDRLRHKLRDLDEPDVPYIVNSRGRGYRLEIPEDRDSEKEGAQKPWPSLL